MKISLNAIRSLLLLMPILSALAKHGGHKKMIPLLSKKNWLVSQSTLIFLPNYKKTDPSFLRSFSPVSLSISYEVSFLIAKNRSKFKPKDGQVVIKRHCRNSVIQRTVLTNYLNSSGRYWISWKPCNWSPDFSDHRRKGRFRTLDQEI